MSGVPGPSGGQASGDVTIGVSISIPEPWAGHVQRAHRRYGDPLAELVQTHITLLGPTRLAAQEVPVVERHLAAVARRSAPFRIRLAGSGTFRPVTKVVFLHLVEGAQGCEALAAAVRTGPLACEQAYPYHPHVTLAQEVAADQLDAAERDFADFTVEFAGDRFDLSVFQEDGRWRTLRSYALGGAPFAGAEPMTSV